LSLFFEDLQVGMAWDTPARTVTEADLVNFAGVSGDFNPLHTDAEYAKTTPFGQRIAHGLLVLSIATGLRQRLGLMDRSLIGFMEIRSWRFKKPVFIGDTVRVRTEIAELRPTSKPDRGVVVQAVKVLNQRDEIVQEGEFVLMVRTKAGAQVG